MYIYDAQGAGNAPGSVVGTLFGSIPINTVPNTATNMTATGTSLQLGGNTNYDVVLKGNGLANTYLFTFTSSNAGAPGSYGAGLFSSGWSVAPLYFIASVQAVPEPSTWALGVMGSGAAALAARRRKRHF